MKHVKTDPICVQFDEPVWWWQRRKFNRMRGRDCPVCRGRLGTPRPIRDDSSAQEGD